MKSSFYNFTLNFFGNTRKRVGTNYEKINFFSFLNSERYLMSLLQSPSFEFSHEVNSVCIFS